MNIGVIGAGSWGTALANLLASQGVHAVTLWAYEPDLVERMRTTGENDLFLPGFFLSPTLEFTTDLRAVVVDKDLLLLVSPSQVMRSVVQQIRGGIPSDTIIVSAAKGIENNTLLTMSQVLREVLPAACHSHLAVLSGPSFAKEVAAGMPTAVVAAAADHEVAVGVQQAFSTATFRVYSNNDVLGVELCGALKNVMALAAGVSDGLGFGYNTRAALITRGLAEMTRLGMALGAEATTFAGLAGMGDLVLTCTGDLSRNRSVGMALGQGKTLDEILAGMKMVAEGVKTTLSAYQLAAKHGVEVPIIEQMYNILYEQKDPQAAVAELLAREPKPEVS
ncbi:MAG: NAD(P)-dependent glycerol-3-phosphate dehydrogenase [Deltaproteobacteria bacterium]|nr:NAD(P)-dependent glycerol-3-phosphate dehydrogenase [Candidatus Anaeroferrophillus wilburensis]MBN2888118.1 NAD(P)-dependent glycerol-3-phosphate dehydrogenase [Deltaproteobacteria bacterium]